MRWFLRYVVPSGRFGGWGRVQATYIMLTQASHIHNPLTIYLLLLCTDHGAISGRWIFFVKLWVFFSWDIFTWFHDWSVGAEHLRRLQNIIKRKVRKCFERPIYMKLHMKGNDAFHGALIIIPFSNNVAPKFPFGKLEWWFSICKGRISQVEVSINYIIYFFKGILDFDSLGNAATHLWGADFLNGLKLPSTVVGYGLGSPPQPRIPVTTRMFFYIFSLEFL